MKTINKIRWSNNKGEYLWTVPDGLTMAQGVQKIIEMSSDEDNIKIITLMKETGNKTQYL